ncbi:hypothetical protein [Alteromonas sp. KUL49]|uniref:hypothetical protein n=1 Tax=Alteromonas sp. KUL49 TaxID=2480798 RepID=UPI00102F28A8|nr:hypothetical protein [Alteromonas sp. KUL49]TAP37885.1 hypothetical protein EYS00_15410 [Alteromonas sp. KUL49]GEA12745.1 hypothetical protein KUL49_31200 [Alteromonas sp. KUL49]
MKRKVKNLVKRFLGKSEVNFHLDTVSGDIVSGWAVNNVNPSLPCEVRLVCEDKVLAKTKAATLREDLVAAGIGNGCHGFTLQLDMLPFSADAREAHLYINDKRVTSEPISLQSSFTDVLGEFSIEVERRMDALLAIQNERMQREFDYIKKQLQSGE